MKLQKIKFVAVGLAMASLGSCGMKELTKNDAQTKDAKEADANLTVYRVRPVDEKPRYVLGNYSTQPNLKITADFLEMDFSGDFSGVGKVSQSGFMVAGPHESTTGAGVTYAEVDIEVIGSDGAEAILDFTTDGGSKILGMRSISPSQIGRQMIRFNPVIHDGILKDIEVRVRATAQNGQSEHTEYYNNEECISKPGQPKCPLLTRYFAVISPKKLTVRVYETKIFSYKRL